MTQTWWMSLQSSLAQTLVAAAWQDLLLGATAALVLTALRGRRAAARHTVGMLFLIAMVAWPAWQLATTLGAEAGSPPALSASLSGMAIPTQETAAPTPDAPSGGSL